VLTYLSLLFLQTTWRTSALWEHRSHEDGLDHIHLQSQTSLLWLNQSHWLLRVLRHSWVFGRGIKWKWWQQWNFVFQNEDSVVITI